jgi:ribosomal protein S18 acetylase RimI-like enzyme
MPEAVGTTELAGDLVIRAAAVADVPAVTRLDSRITGMTKSDYWADMFERYGKRPDRFFLIAEEAGGGIVGFIIGEVRAWEFGSPPSGWIFALGVDPKARLKKIGSRLFQAICADLAASGVDTVRTMLARDDELNMAFFRSQGMMGGPFIQLEMSLDGFAGGQR